MSSGGSKRSFRGGAYGRGGRSQGRSTNGGRSSESNHHERELGLDNEPFMLPPKPTNKQSKAWLLTQELWARANVSRHNWHLILRSDGGEEPEYEIYPVEPDFDDFVDRIPEYASKAAGWRDSCKEIRKRNEEIETDGKKTYGQLIKYLSPEFVLNIKSKYGQDFLNEENSKKLVDAINSEFLGMNTHGASGHYEVAEQTKLYNSTYQSDNQSLAEYHERKKLAYRTLVQGTFHLQQYTLDAFSVDEIFDSLVTPEQRASNFLMGLNKKIFESYLTDLKLQRGGEEWPSTVEQAYERASALEEHLLKKYRSARHHNEGDGYRTPVMVAGAKGTKFSKGKGQPEKPAQKTDSRGKKLCHYEEKNGAGSCPRKDSCWFSHDIDHVGTKGTIAVAKVQKDRDPNCGGGPAPSGKG